MRCGGSFEGTRKLAPLLSGAEQEHRVLFGRRRGRPLRPRQRLLKEELLPRLAITLPACGALDPQALFPGAARPVWLEIGFGGGEHLATQAASHPQVGFIGVEVFDNGIAKLVADIAQQHLANIRIFADDARLLLARLPPRSIDRTFILFPDPWPKRRHWKRRIIAPAILDRLAMVMAEGAELRLATDDRSYLAWILQHLTEHPDFEWLARRPADWREHPPDWPPTRYEEKARAAGRAPVFLRAKRRVQTG
ncbi:MAG: tRNA (guanosine(46)-N7)-methyltransferase TrmB [Stellaceae bacterium]